MYLLMLNSKLFNNINKNILSHLSGVSLLGVPSEIYTHGTQYLLVALIPVISSLIVVYIYLPVFYELQTTSAYEVCHL